MEAATRADAARQPQPVRPARPRPTVAVLAVQGAFAEHERRLERLGCTCRELRQAADLARPFDALVLPGGESTTQAKLLRDLGMLDPLHALIAAGLPTLGTCAGLILLAERVMGGGPDGHAANGNGTRTESDASAATRNGGATARAGAFATLPVTVQRNAYGRQLGSFHTCAPFCDAEGSNAEPVPMTFIRAPRITGLHAGARPLVRLHGEAAAVQAGNQMGCAFHPELDDSDAVYERFLELIENWANG